MFFVLHSIIEAIRYSAKVTVGRGATNVPQHVQSNMRRVRGMYFYVMASRMFLLFSNEGTDRQKEMLPESIFYAKY